MKLWDVSSSTLVATINGHNGDVYKVAFAPNERQIASVGTDKIVRLVDVNSSESMSSGIEASSPQDQRVSIVTLAYTLDGGAIFTIDDDLVIRQWNREALAGGGGVGGGLYVSDLYTSDIEDMFFLWSAAFSPDRHQIAASFDDGSIRMSSVQSGPDTPPATLLKGHLRAVSCMTYSPCGRWLLSACLDKAVRLWDLNNDRTAPGQEGYVLVQLEKIDPLDIMCVAFSPTGHQLAVGFSTGTVSLLDPLTKALVIASKKEVAGRPAYRSPANVEVLSERVTARDGYCRRIDLPLGHCSIGDGDGVGEGGAWCLDPTYGGIPGDQCSCLLTLRDLDRLRQHGRDSSTVAPAIGPRG